MFLLVTVARTREVLRLDSTMTDDLIAFYISASSRLIVSYLKDQAGDLLSMDSPANSPPDDLADVPEDIAMAVIMLVGHMYRNPDANYEDAFGLNRLPLPVTALLTLYRDPALR